MKKIVLIDAYAQIYRCYFAIQHLTNWHNEPVNALYGIARMLLSVEDIFPCDFGAVVFDLGKCTRRCNILPAYKAQRPPMPDDLKAQTGKIRQWMQAFGWHLLEKEGIEADDIIATLATHAEGNQVAILSKDKDLAQVVSDSVTLYSASKADGWTPLKPQQIQEKFGVSPEFILDYLALIGDTADNIPGVDGVGPKTAAKLIAQFGNISGILAHSAEITNEKLRNKISSANELLIRNIELVKLDTNAYPNNWNGMEALKKSQPNWQLLLNLANEENFKSIADIIQGKIKQSETREMQNITEHKANIGTPPEQLTFDFFNN